LVILHAHRISPLHVTLPCPFLSQGHLARHTLFPCPDPVLGKGVLVQTTLWGNLILGPTARDVHKPDARDMTPASVQEYILGKCKRLVPAFDAREAFHAFAGARAKSDRNDWIVGPSPKDPRLIHVAGIDSPGLAGAPAIALDVVRMLEEAGLEMVPDPGFNPNRAPIITPKDGMRGLKMGPAGKFDSDGIDEAKMASNVVCKCERVTELEVVRAMRRSLPIDSSQGIRKRTRAGMGHCQGDPDNYGCEARVRAIVARENGVPVGQVGARPWPATSTLPQRWIDDGEKRVLQERMDRSS
jgi:glycerol-3-phosphate dehydrogenase